MALLRLRDTQTRAKRLPEVCMACGEPSTDTIKKTFSWYPPWIGLLIFVGGLPIVIVLALVLTKRMTVDVPVCDRHRGYFWKRSLMIWMALIVPFSLGAAFFAIALAVADRRDESSVVAFSCLGFILVLVAAIIAIAFIQNTAIRPKEITDRDISLVRVHEDFIEAWEQQRDPGWTKTTMGRDDGGATDMMMTTSRARSRDMPPERRESFRERPDDEDRPRRRRSADED